MVSLRSELAWEAEGLAGGLGQTFSVSVPARDWSGGVGEVIKRRRELAGIRFQGE